MDSWIESLWTALKNAPWGERDLIEATSDLDHLARAGLVSGEELDGVLEERVNKELQRITTPQFKQGWRHRERVVSGIEEKEEVLT